MPQTKGLSPNARAIITSKLTKPVEAAAEAYVSAVRENISRGSRSGKQHSGLPYQSSSPSEYPQQQSDGDDSLVANVDTSPTNNPLVWTGGFSNQPQGKLNALEFGYNEGNLEARAPLQRTSNDPETRKAMLDAAIKAGRGQ